MTPIVIAAMSIYKIREHLERSCNLKELPRDAESMNLDVFEIVVSDQEALELIDVLSADSGPVQVEQLVLS